MKGGGQERGGEREREGVGGREGGAHSGYELVRRAEERGSGRRLCGEKERDEVASRSSPCSPRSWHSLRLSCYFYDRKF